MGRVEQQRPAFCFCCPSGIGCTSWMLFSAVAFVVVALMAALVITVVAPDHFRQPTISSSRVLGRFFSFRPTIPPTRTKQEAQGRNDKDSEEKETSLGQNVPCMLIGALLTHSFKGLQKLDLPIWPVRTGTSGARHPSCLCPIHCCSRSLHNFLS